MLFNCIMKLVHGFFLLFRESLKGEYIFFAFFGSVCTENSIFCLLLSLPSHLENSIGLIEFCRFISSSTRFNVHLVSGVDIDAVRVE